MLGNTPNENKSQNEIKNTPSQREIAKQGVKASSVENRNRLQNELTLDQQKVLLDTNEEQKKKIDMAVDRIKENFKNIYNLGTPRAKNSIQSLSLSFIKEIAKVDEYLTKQREIVSKDPFLNEEEKVAKILSETIHSMDPKIQEILEFAESFADDIKKNGGKNSLEALLKAEDELKTYLEIIHSDADIREALAFVYDISFDGTKPADKKDKIFKILAGKIIDPSSNLRAWALIVKKLSLNEIKEFKEKHFNENKPLLVDMIVKSGDSYASMIYIDLYGESEYLAISGLDEKQKAETVEGHRSITDYQAKAERLERSTIGSKNAAAEMLSGENLLGAFGMAWGISTAGLNLFVEFGSGKFKENPSKAIGSALKNPYIIGGALAGTTGYAILSGGVSSFLEEHGPEEEKIAEEKQKASNRMKNILISDSSPLNKLISQKGAIFALTSFGKNKLLIDGLKDISELKNPEQTLTKRYFSEYLMVLINEPSISPEDKKSLEALFSYIEGIPYDDKSFSELIKSLLVLEIGGQDIKATDDNFKVFNENL